MKKSHRKDVIIARIIFAAILLLLIAIIVGLVSLALSAGKKKEEPPKQEPTQTQQYFVVDPNQEDTEIESESEPETMEEEPETVTVRTTRRVNLRTEPNTDCEVITVLEADTHLVLQQEADGWAEVLYNDRTGYISMEYVEYVVTETPDADTAN